MQKADLETAYRQRYNSKLKDLATGVRQHLQETLVACSRIDSITARAKSPERFITKARKTENGQPKYGDPFREIQDQIGARVTVFYIGDVERIRKEVLKYYRHIEAQDKAPEKDEEFGYFGVHFILSVPEDLLPDGQERTGYPEFFELQIKTLFQHAWSEAHHDLGYKSQRDLSAMEKRKVAFTAAQAWGADQMFDELFNQIENANDNEQQD